MDRPPPSSRHSRPPQPGRGPAAPLAVKSGVPHGATELGWLPDCVYTGEKFEAGVAFFADTVGRITRFSREPADLAAARRLEGQAALPGLVNVHSHAFHRALRGRTEQKPREAEERLLQRLTDEDVFATARMAFLEMLLSGVTCVGEFHYLHRMPDGKPWPDVNQVGRAIVRAAHDVGIRIALLNVASLRGDFGGDESSLPVRARSGSAEAFVRDTEALRVAIEREFPADEAWLGVGAYSLAQVPLEAFKVIAAYARAQRMRLHAHGATTAAETRACAAEYGRSAVALLAEHGIVDKRLTLVDALQLSDDDVKLLGAARATVGVCPSSAQQLGLGAPVVEKLLAAGAGLALGSDRQVQIDLLKEARLLEYQLRTAREKRAGIGADPATALFHAATVTGARSLGATGGALEVGRPADFFTVNLYDPSIAGADAASLLAHVIFSLDRRAVRDVWVGARQRIANGRHVAHGAIVGRFVDGQKRIWEL
ncbi:MAG: amidohydrolase family protein [Opitutaceae bacterium]|nr:amidohydrolase family protein [Opitutaceae bacterium]